MTRATVRIVLERDDYGATLSELTPGGAATLAWTDYVANDWHEWFPSLAEGLMRLALLDNGSRTERFFTESTPAPFAEAAQKFMDDHLG